MAISVADNAMARDIISRNAYAKFLENKKLMLAWLAHVPKGTKPEDVKYDVWIPFLFFVRTACYNTMFDVAYHWLGHDAFVEAVYALINMREVHQHEMLYMAKNRMIDPAVYSERYPHSPV